MYIYTTVRQVHLHNRPIKFNGKGTVTEILRSTLMKTGSLFYVENSSETAI